MPLVQKTQFDQKLIRKAVKLALDDFKNKYAGFLLSANTLKVDLCFTVSTLECTAKSIIKQLHFLSFKVKVLFYV